MKKAAVCMAAFYLLLITGMYACIVSCGSGHIKEFLTSISFNANHNETKVEAHCKAGGEKHCDGGEDCPCCEKHGSYTVKENIKPDSSFELVIVPPLAECISYFTLFTAFSVEPALFAWPNVHPPPPPGSSPPIFIKVRSLLI